MKNSNEKYTILYARLSQDDGKEGVSNSIENQKLILETYANENGFENCLFKYDDGFSGTNFNRPAWKEVENLIETNQVETLIIKDTSRLGRDYLQTGNLIEHTFPNHNVRFISISDNVDSLYGIDDFLPFKSLFDDYYAKECSKKQRAVRKAKAEKGERIATRAAFGYRKCADDPKKIEIDPEPAETVKRIFELCIQGKGPTQIANQLENEQRVNPTNYYFNKTGIRLTNLDTSNPYKWSASTISDILKDIIYLGHTASLKYTTVSYKNKKMIIKDKEDWVIFENTHKAIIGKEDWDIAQNVRETKKRPRKNFDTPNMFSGLVKCADCGKYLVLHRSHTMSESKNNFMCSNYRKKGKDVCTSHYFREQTLYSVVLDDIKRVTLFARMRSNEFAEFIAKKSTTQTRLQIANLSKEIEILRKRNAELDSLFKRLYEDNVLGKIPNEVFRKLSDEYLIEQKEIKLLIPKKEEELENLRNSLTNAQKFIDKANKYLEIETLTPEILRHFVSKILVHERAERYSRTAEQKIEIHYIDIGYLGDYSAETDIAPPDLTPPPFDVEVTEDGKFIVIEDIPA